MSNDNILNQLKNSTSPNQSNTSSDTLGGGATQKKTKYLKHKILRISCIGSSLLILLTIMIVYYQYLTKDCNEEIVLLNYKIDELRKRSNNLEARANDIKKYQQAWVRGDAKKKNFDGISIANINNIFHNLSEKYQLSESSINISVPEIVKGGIYNSQNFDVYLIKCAMDFNALTDKVAIDFINSFLDYSPTGQIIINDLSIKKTKKDGYSYSDLVNISTGQFKGLTAAKVSFSWYFLKYKTNKLKADG